MFRNGANAEIIARDRLPAEILETDCVLGSEVPSGWLDLQEILCSLLCQEEDAVSSLQRLEDIEKKALALLQSDPDESLFMLFQALANKALGYCATHALLSAVVCELIAEKLEMADRARRSLFRSALTMNIGMARLQDDLARQSSAPVEAQRKLILDHPQKSLEILKNLGVTDEDQLDIVRWHHELSESCAMAGNAMSRGILRMTDCFVAKMAPRKTRLAMSPLGAVKSLCWGAAVDAAPLSAALATALGFYPPGTYVQLVNGEKAVAVKRGLCVNHPHVVSIVNPGGMPLSKYLYRDTANPQFAIRTPLNAEKIKVEVNLEKILKARMSCAA